MFIGFRVKCVNISGMNPREQAELANGARVRLIKQTCQFRCPIHHDP